jgi:hypothetical protein
VHSLEAIEDVRLLGTLLKAGKPQNADRGTQKSQDHARGEKLGHGIAG